MSTPNEKGTPQGITEALDAMRQAIEQIMENQADLSSKVALLTTAQDIMASQIAHQIPAINASSATEGLPVRSLESVLASADRRGNIFSTSTSSAGPLTPVKQEPGVDRGPYNEEAKNEVPGHQPTQRYSRAQTPRDLLEQLPPPITDTDNAMPENWYHSGDPTRRPVPVRQPHYDPTRKGLTGVIIGDQVPFEHRLAQFDVYSVYVFLREVQRYETQYEVQLNVVNYITEDILDAISGCTESTMDLPSKPRTWSPWQLNIAMMRYFKTFKYTARVLCEIAERVATFPKTGPPSANTTVARMAINQLAQIPIYAQRLVRFQNFVVQYQLLERDWPTEHMKDWTHPKRLNEVLAETLKKHAPQAYALLADELTLHRKLPISPLLKMLPDIARTKIHDLHQVDETLEKINRTNTKPPDLIRTAGVGRSFLRAPPTGPDSRAANYVASKPKAWGPTPQGGKLNNLTEAEDVSEEDDYDTWRENETALDLEQLEEVREPEDINHIHATAEAAVDRSKQICHSHLFHPQGCINTQRGKQCPFSHDSNMGIAELTKVLEKLKQSSRS